MKMMRRMDLEEILRLRHTSRVFMRLFNDRTFEPHHLTAKQDFKRFCDTARLWAVPAEFFPGQKMLLSVPLCDACSAKRQEDHLGRPLLAKMDSLYCSGCRATHRDMHFSALQRGEKNDDARVCLGHEGAVSPCSHLSASLVQVKARANRTPWECCCVLRHTINLGQHVVWQPVRLTIACAPKAFTMNMESYTLLYSLYHTLRSRGCEAAKYAPRAFVKPWTAPTRTMGWEIG